MRHNYSDAGVIDSTWATSTGSATFLGRRYLWTASLGRLNTIRVGGRTTSLSYNSNQQLTSITYLGSHVVEQQYTTGHMKARVLDSWNPGWGNVRYGPDVHGRVNAILELVLHLIGLHLEQGIYINDGWRPEGACTGPRCEPQSLHLTGMAADIVNTPDQSRNMRTLAHQIGEFLDSDRMSRFGSFQLGWYTGANRGHVHVGLGVFERYGYVGNNKVSFDHCWP